jgi:hypothetical protein
VHRIGGIHGNDRKKGPSEKFERPKSREETPKEGSGSTSPNADTAMQQYVIAAHKTQGLNEFLRQL